MSIEGSPLSNRIFEEEDEEEESKYPDYGAAGFWNESYDQNRGSFEWYFGWDRLSSEITSLYFPEDRCLVLGCGNSPMSADMLKSGFQKVVSVDLSPIVISQMKEKYKSEQRLEWLEMDATKMAFENGIFDLIVDKGLLDAILCRIDGDELAEVAVSEIFRVLAEGGRFILISFGSPGQRLPVVRKVRRDWICNPVIVVPPAVGDPKETKTYIYVFVKCRM
jgi:ubiquinone/menaquinone biosynthesis C-methylase UbiE